MSRTIKILISTDLGGENPAGLGSLFWLFSQWSRVGHALRPSFMLWLFKIWRVSSNGKVMQHLQTCFLIAEADRVLCRHLVMFLTIFFLRMYKMKYICYQDSSVIHGWFVYSVYGWEMRRLSKSSEIQFRMALFSFYTPPDLSPSKLVEHKKSGLVSYFGVPSDREMKRVNFLAATENYRVLNKGCLLYTSDAADE